LIWEAIGCSSELIESPENAEGTIDALEAKISFANNSTRINAGQDFLIIKNLLCNTVL
jgi:hypothetical protein